MSVQWRKNSKNKKIDPKKLLDDIQSFTEFLQGGGRKTDPFKEQAHLVTILSFIEGIPNHIPQSYIMKAIKTALITTLKASDVSTDVLLRNIKKEIGQYHRLPEKEYRLISSLSVSKVSSLTWIKIDDCRVSFTSQLSKKYQNPRSRFLSEINVKENLRYLFVIVSTKARTEHEAAEKCLEALDTVRGILNLGLNFSMSLHIAGVKRQAVNRVTLGCIHTLHLANGQIAGNDYWEEPEYQVDKMIFDLNSLPNVDVYDYIRDVIKKLKKSKFRMELKTAIIRYVRALDYQDANVSFIKLWSVLEYLTDTGSGSYDETIRRTVFLLKNRDMEKLVLEHLRQSRNQSVHTGSDSLYVKTNIYQLQKYIKVLIFYHLENMYDFSSFQEACEFFDSPTEKRELENNIKRHEMKLKMCKSAIKYLNL